MMWLSVTWLEEEEGGGVALSQVSASYVTSVSRCHSHMMLHRSVIMQLGAFFSIYIVKVAVIKTMWQWVLKPEELTSPRLCLGSLLYLSASPPSLTFIHSQSQCIMFRSWQAAVPKNKLWKTLCLKSLLRYFLHNRGLTVSSQEQTEISGTHRWDGSQPWNSLGSLLTDCWTDTRPQWFTCIASIS